MFHWYPPTASLQHFLIPVSHLLAEPATVSWIPFFVPFCVPSPAFLFLQKPAKCLFVRLLSFSNSCLSQFTPQRVAVRQLLHTAHANSLKHLSSLKLSSFRRFSRTVDQKGTISPYGNILYTKLLLKMNSVQQTHKILKNGSLPLQCGLRTGVSSGGIPCLSTVLRGAYKLGGFRQQRQDWGRPIHSHTACEFIVCNAVLWTHVLGRQR